MTRKTPPRPVDLAGAFPALRSCAGTATRLHPRAGAPTAADSSIGGPLLWPAGEPWPTCTGEHREDVLRRPDDVRRRRRILSAAWGRTRRGQDFQITDEERAALAEAEQPPPWDMPAGPRWMLAVAQLYRHDVPGFIGPPHADVLQMLWCPLDHPPDYVPAVFLRWRRAADVVDRLVEQPEPALMEDAYYLPDPCVLHPEQVTEYPYEDFLPGDLAERIRAWEGDRPEGYDYGDLAIAPGWKMGGFAEWGLTDPYPMTCHCGEDMRLLLAVGGVEWDPRTGLWRPVEDGDDGEYHSFPSPYDPTEVQIGRGYRLWIFYCPASFDHPHQLATQ